MTNHHEQPQNPAEQSEQLEKIDLKALNFEQLKQLSQEVSELAKTTFREVEDGFENINKEGIAIMEKKDGQYVVASLSKSLPEFHHYMLSGKNKTLTQGGSREELMRAIREMVIATGGRIIE